MKALLLFLGAFAATAALEGAAAWLAGRKRRMVYYSFLCNLLTNPAANLLMALFLILFGEGAYVPALILLETLVVAAEAGVYRLLAGFSTRKALGFSLLLNGISCLAGILYGLART